MLLTDMMSLLGLKIEDASKRKFSAIFLLKALDTAQLKLAQELHPSYLTELQVRKTGVTVTSGRADLGSVLDYDVLKGAQGIFLVQVTSGLFATRLSQEDLRDTENELLAPSTINPCFHVFENYIYMLPSTITSIIVWHLKIPSLLWVESAYGLPLYEIEIDTVTDGNDFTCKNSDPDFQGLVQTNDFYNGWIIKHGDIGSEKYFIVNDYVAGTCQFLIEPAASPVFVTGDHFRFFTESKQYIHGSLCDLNPSLYELLVTLAEAECWTMDGQLDRYIAAKDIADMGIAVLNERYTRIAGIGTKIEGR